MRENVSKEGVISAYSLGRVGAEGVRDAEAVDVGVLAVGGAEVGERKVDLGGGDGVAPVPEHLQECPPSQVVAVALDAAVVHVSAHAPRPRLSVRRRHSRTIDLRARRHALKLLPPSYAVLAHAHFLRESGARTRCQRGRVDQ